MIALLCQANALVGEAQDLKALPTGDVERLRTRYDTILTEAEAGNPPVPAVLAPAGASNNPQPATSFGDCASTATRSCASSPTGAFTSTITKPNATCEGPNSSRKVSGCFRSETGGDAFAIIRSCLSTRRKQSDDLFNSLVLTFQGQPPMPQLE